MEVVALTKEEEKPAVASRLSYPDIFQLLHSEDTSSTEKLVAEYEAIRLSIKENGPLSDEESSEDDDLPTTPTRLNAGAGARRGHGDKANKRSISQISDERPYPRGRIPAGSSRQPKLKKSKLMQKITGRKNARPVPMPGM
ncbi:Aste57867_16795 [Aphanomyces stellatus]|uniref:Aste57867_16795 protein n=1 Tax=Aphanomyces stellatus TaxID=120398 RepID=A0A485L6D9_9STRA|nr:hypothetical protein As57867_016738 [Aphanomyces stellatus]VFT93560.1 Aste57867_16795 [Aphanomyces stellatus]